MTKRTRSSYPPGYRLHIELMSVSTGLAKTRTNIEIGTLAVALHWESSAKTPECAYHGGRSGSNSFS